MVSPNYFRVINASIHVVVFVGCAAYALDLVTNKGPSGNCRVVLFLGGL